MVNSKESNNFFQRSNDRRPVSQVFEKTIDEAFFHVNQYQSLKVPGQFLGSKFVRKIKKPGNAYESMITGVGR